MSIDNGVSWRSSVHLKNGSGKIRFLKGTGCSDSQQSHLSLITRMKYIGCIISNSGTVRVNCIG